MSFPRYPKTKPSGVEWLGKVPEHWKVKPLRAFASINDEVLPHAPDAWIDHEKTKVGYEIPLNRHFYVFTPPRPLAEIDCELKGVTDRILKMIGGLTK